MEHLGTFLTLLTVFQWHTTCSAQDSELVISYNGCGATKSCWFEPRDCPAGDGDTSQCSYGLTWQSDGDDVVLEMLAQTAGLSKTAFYPSNWGSYISVAFSHDQFMGDDSVVECVNSQNGPVKAFISYNDDVANERIYYNPSSSILSPYSDANGTLGGVYDGQLRCRIRRLISPNPNSLKEPHKVFDLKDNKYILQLAKGNADSQTYGLTMHYLMDGDFFPWVSSKSYDLSSSSHIIVDNSHHYVFDIPRSRQYQMAAWHGILLLFAWWFLGAIGMLMSRHFKKSWPGKKLLGEQVWFQIHRDLFIASVILQVIAIILVFVQNGGWLGTCSLRCTRDDNTKRVHTWVGMISTVAAFLQIPVGLLRPAATHQLRPLFNFGHWLFGIGSFVLAAVAMFTSITLGKGGIQYKWTKYQVDYVMAGYIALYLLVAILLEVLSFYSERRGKATFRPDDPIGLTSGPISMRPKAQPNRTTGSISNRTGPITPISTISGKELNGSAKGHAAKYTKAEVAKHNSEDSCWIIIYDKVYDVTKFLDDHPGGGEAVLEYAGTDGTRGFEDFDHSDFASNQKEDYLIGEIVESERKNFGTATNLISTDMITVKTKRNSLFSSLKIIILTFFIVGSFAFCCALSYMIWKAADH